MNHHRYYLCINVENGVFVLQSGKHDELMRQRGLYYTLVCQQEKQEQQSAPGDGSSSEADSSNGKGRPLPQRHDTAQG